METTKASTENPTKTKDIFHVIGLMSGSSCDGLDIVYVEFQYSSESTTYKVLEGKTVGFDEALTKKLLNAHKLETFDFLLFDREFGHWIGEQIVKFISEKSIPKEKIDFVCSHGHSIFHQPQKRITVQIGHGASIAAECGLTVISDFRSLDVALKGQGAPLVPIGDRVLFKDYTFCLNLGGICNVSFEENPSKSEESKRIAYDITYCNMGLNYYANKAGKTYDEDGNLAKAGTVNQDVLSKLKNLSFFQSVEPKSLGREYFESDFLPIVESANLDVKDCLATLVEHAADLIADAIKLALKKGTMSKPAKMLCTGGGAHNKYLISRLSEKLEGECEVVVPDALTVDFKEALVFGFLGVLRWLNKPNCLQSCTGAIRNCIGGCIYQG